MIAALQAHFGPRDQAGVAAGIPAVGALLAPRQPGAVVGAQGDLVVLQAEHLARLGRVVGDGAVLIGQDDADRHGLDNVAVARLACPQRLLHILAVGHVYEGRREAEQFARGPGDDGGRPLHNAQGAVAAQRYVFARPCSVLAQRREHFRGLFGVEHEVGQLAAQDFFAAFVPPKAQERGIDVGDMALEVRDHCRTEGRGNYGFPDAQLFRCVAGGLGWGDSAGFFVGPYRHREILQPGTGLPTACGRQNEVTAYKHYTANPRNIHAWPFVTEAAHLDGIP